MHGQLDAPGLQRVPPKPLEGPAGALFARKARQYDTYLVGTLILREGPLASNAAVLFDRNGEVAGIYRKVNPVAEPGLEPMPAQVSRCRALREQAIKSP